jgi:hypothetical protein
MIILVWLLWTLIEPPAIADSLGDRLALAAHWLLLPALLLFAMLVVVGNSRFLSEAIDPTLHREDQRMVVDGRVADNTVQQLLIFAIGLCALSVSLPRRSLSVIPALTITFVVARLVFWFGYRVHPLYRAPGFSSTAYLNLGMLVAALWLWLR